MECTHQVLACGQVDPHLSAHRAVHLGQKGGGNLNKWNAAKVGGCDEACEIPHHTATQGHHKGLSLEALLSQLMIAALNSPDGLGLLSRRDHDQGCRKPCFFQGGTDDFGVEGGDVPIRDDGTTLAQTQGGTGSPHLFHQAGSNPDIITSFAQGNRYNTHSPRIGTSTKLSKVHRPSNVPHTPSPFGRPGCHQPLISLFTFPHGWHSLDSLDHNL